LSLSPLATKHHLIHPQCTQRAKRPKGPPCRLTTTPTPTPPMLKSLKSASMSWKHCRMALASPTVLPGHGSTFLWLLHQRQTRIRSPFAALSAPSTQRHTKRPTTQRCRNNISCSCPPRSPIPIGWYKTNIGGLNASPGATIAQKKAKTMPASSGSASALPSNVAGNRVQLCTRF